MSQAYQNGQAKAQQEIANKLETGWGKSGMGANIRPKPPTYYKGAEFAPISGGKMRIRKSNGDLEDIEGDEKAARAHIDKFKNVNVTVDVSKEAITNFSKKQVWSERGWTVYEEDGLMSKGKTTYACFGPKGTIYKRTDDQASAVAAAKEGISKGYKKY